MGVTTRALIAACLLLPIAGCGSEGQLSSGPTAASSVIPETGLPVMQGQNELTTTFARQLPDDRLNNLTLQLDQTAFYGFGNVDYRFEYTSEGTIRAVVQRTSRERLLKLSRAIDTELARIVHDTTFSTEITRSDAISPVSWPAPGNPRTPSTGEQKAERVLLDTTVMTDYGQFDLVWGGGVAFNGDFDPLFAGQVNGLVGAAEPEVIYVNLAKRSGGSKLVIRSLPGPPAPPAETWEDVVEVSTELPDGEPVRWQTWAGETHGELPPLLSGPHRVRVSARGRDQAADGEGTDTYLIEFWPAPMRPDAILQTTSSNAAYWHGANGGKR